MPTKFKAITLRQIPHDLHKALKVLAAHKGLPLYRVIIDLLYEAVRREKQDNGDYQKRE